MSQQQIRLWSERNGQKDVQDVGEGGKKAGAKRVAAKVAKPRKTAPKSKSRKAAKPALPNQPAGYAPAALTHPTYWNHPDYDTSSFFYGVRMDSNATWARDKFESP